MKNQLVYFVLLGAVASSVVMFLKIQHEHPNAILAHQFRAKMDFNQKFSQKKLDNLLVLTPEMQETSLYDVMDPTGCSVIVLASFNQCSVCRDDELERWSHLLRQHPQANVLLLASEGKPLTQQEIKQAFASAKVPDHGIPVLLDAQGEAVHLFGIESAQAPLWVLINNATKEIAWVNQTGEATRLLDEAFATICQEII